MILVEEFIKQPREVRRAHLDLSEPCIERGGNSTNHKGVLAQYLDTNIPKGRILLCHGCHNGACSNPKHLYWGTDIDNLAIDRAEQPGGHQSPWDRSVKKYGIEEARRRQGKIGNTFGAGNRGKSKSEAHKRKISESIKRLNGTVEK